RWPRMSRRCRPTIARASMTAPTPSSPSSSGSRSDGPPTGARPHGAALRLPRLRGRDPRGSGAVSTGAANRRRGTQFETDLVKHFRSKGMDTERLRLSGKEDEGDIVVRIGRDQRVVVEAKSGKNIRPRFWWNEEAVPEAR